MLLAHLLFLLTTLTAPLPAQPTRFGVPACNTNQQQELADRLYFLLCHDATRKVPSWVGYELKRSHRLATLTASTHLRRPSHFRTDFNLVHAGARDADYRNSGYSRGHMAPAADFAYSAEALRATFLLSNAAPQRQNVNAGVWSQLERNVRILAARSDAVYVFTGPIFDPVDVTFIGTNRVAVPTHFYKVVLAIEQENRIMYAAIVPNTLSRGESLNAFLTTVDEVERRTGLDFFHQLADDEEHLLESRQNAIRR